MKSREGMFDIKTLLQKLGSIKDITTYEVLRKCCIYYDVAFPEINTFKQNDVYQSLVVFAGRDYFSKHFYFTNEAKDNVAENILKYFIRNFDEVIEADRKMREDEIKLMESL